MLSQKLPLLYKQKDPQWNLPAFVPVLLLIVHLLPAEYKLEDLRTILFYHFHMMHRMFDEDKVDSFHM
jgi:hypothetical protein